MSREIQVPLQRDADLRAQNEHLKSSLDKAAIDVANLQTQLTAALRKITFLERQVAKAEQKQVPQSDVIDVFEHFLALVWSGRGRKPVLDEAKTKLIRQRLREDRSVADLKLAIAGLAKKPNVGDKGRCGPGNGKRHADLKHALRDDDTLLRFIGYAEEAEPVQLRPRSLDAVVMALADHLGTDAVMPDVEGERTVGYWTKCPVEKGAGYPVRLTVERGVPVFACAHPTCTPAGLVAAVDALLGADRVAA